MFLIAAIMKTCYQLRILSKKMENPNAITEKKMKEFLFTLFFPSNSKRKKNPSVSLKKKQNPEVEMNIKKKKGLTGRRDDENGRSNQWGGRLFG